MIIQNKITNTNSMTIFNWLNIFFIYSFTGFIIETIYVYIKTGRIKNRKTMRFLPFCTVYGIGAIILLISLHQFKNEPLIILFMGIIAGTIVEYIYAFAIEHIFNITFWQYNGSGSFRGRINLFYSCLWGLLSILLIYYIHPKINMLINTISTNITLIIFVIFIFDIIISSIAFKRAGKKGMFIPACPVITPLRRKSYWRKFHD